MLSPPFPTFPLGTQTDEPEAERTTPILTWHSIFTEQSVFRYILDYFFQSTGNLCKACDY